MGHCADAEYNQTECNRVLYGVALGNPPEDQDHDVKCVDEGIDSVKFRLEVLLRILDEASELEVKEDQIQDNVEDY